MCRETKKVTLELNKNEHCSITNPIECSSNKVDKIIEMVTVILDKEIPMLKNNTLLYNLILYGVVEKIKTVQTVENVLSYIKRKSVKNVDDVRFKNGEVYIKCSM